MKIQLEEIRPGDGSSFRFLVNPRLSDLFYWHSHPELELVFIEAPSGTRHVGEHTSRFEGSDLVLIGPHIPHLNFDYGIREDYEKIVLHLRPDFLGTALASTPELAAVRRLFERSQHGIAFGKETQAVLGERIKRLPHLPNFEQFVEILRLFQHLAEAPDLALLHSQPVENQYHQRERERMRRLYQFIEANFHRKIEISEVAQLSHLTNAAFCRLFKKMTRLTFIEFLNQYRVNQARRLLLAGRTVSEACFECGFESLSYFNRTFRKVTGEGPLAFRQRFGGS